MNKGIFLEYTATIKNTYHLYIAKIRIKTKKYCIFDKGMGYLDWATPNSRQLWQDMGYYSPPDTEDIIAPEDICFAALTSPFYDRVEFDLPIVFDDPTFQFHISQCEIREQGYVSNIEDMTNCAAITT